MHLRELRAYIFPGAAEREPGFHQLITRLSLFGLKVTAGVTIGISFFATFSRLLLMPIEGLTLIDRLSATAWLVCLGMLAFAATRTAFGQRNARLLSMVLAVLVSIALNQVTLRVSALEPGIESYIPSQITLILLVGVAAVPLRPMQTLTLGFALGVVYLLQANLAKQYLSIGSGAIPEHLLFLQTISFMATALSAVLYRQRYLNYQGYVRSLESAEQLRRAETRVLLSDHAASLGRLAAALSHELNSPIGALKSAVDTLMLINARLATADGADHERLLRLQADLRRSLHQSSSRLAQIVDRMQRFTNLDRADVLEADMNELLRDAAALLSAESKHQVAVELDLHPLPKILSRPTQLSAVFHGLLTNAANALSGGRGRIRISSRSTDEAVEILVVDEGKGMKREDLAAIFEPRFHTAGGRIASGNWSMFSFRRILREHGGEIEVESQEGQGTRVRILLPCEACLQESSV
ncbi:MAG: HAMP domain-containing histidine kinase [Bryobacteraceae bacterium]|nr:HAMP domain-containing histidine kinase [Solibacteraceae bacterium]MCO5353647.1 HAMP domain-containing histidine kinase [Bryobacteraceae bacterium]